jgi:triosephosphate isomerase
MSSKKIFAANWKLNKTPEQAQAFAQDFLIQTSEMFFQKKEVFIFPQNFSLDALSREFKSSVVQFGPQQIHTETKGAFTGENSIDLAKSLGSKLCLIGHSERRQFFAEANSFINKKVLLCQISDILPVLCIGESLEQRQKNETLKVCFEQLETALVGADVMKRIVVAYEPVWAIGTGQVATLDQVKEVHTELFKKMNALNFKNFQLLYGGSVKADNAKDLISIPYVDGFLIGGASLEVSSFLDICNCI